MSVLNRKSRIDAAVEIDDFALVGLAIALSQTIVVPRMAKVLRDHQILKWSYFGLAFAMSGYFLAGSKWQMYAIIPVFTFFNGLNMANQSSLISRSAEMGHQGEAMGISSSVMNLAQVPASILVGYITGSISSNMPLIVSTAACCCITCWRFDSMAPESSFAASCLILSSLEFLAA